ncbi:MAG: riboflavin biosynthesis protein RibF [Elusimicrobia bacterium RIFOXYA2_FULL_39_19]|nr:MAG: riboflavin biosynthesis protein RibF [Elusimicrobia bacterium RIFOXYA2_FULL_39_19]
MKKSIVTIGFFDGIHIGHAKLIETTVNTAKKEGLRSVLITFDKKANKNKLLMTLAEKIEYLKTFGLDKIEMIPFTEVFASIAPVVFYRKFLLNRFNMKKVVIGYDFMFGRNRSGNSLLLEKFCKPDNCRVIEIHPMKLDSKVVSSSAIKNCLLNGEIIKVSRMLGRNYSVYGEVKKGQGLGKTLGFPTANLKIDPLKILPEGVFSGFVKFGRAYYPAVANIGSNPTVSHDKSLKFEVHVINCKKNAIIKELRFFFVNKIRTEKKFRNLAELRKQIARDVSFVLSSVKLPSS